MSPAISSESNLQVDVGVLKEQVRTLSVLCDKMDIVIEKLIINHDKTTENIYANMETKRQETQSDIKELHSRITTVDRNLSDKIELTERRIMEEIKNLKKEIVMHNQKEEVDIKKILEWKWMVIGAAGLFVWLISNADKVIFLFR